MKGQSMTTSQNGTAARERQTEQAFADLEQRIETLAECEAEMEEADRIADAATENQQRARENYHKARVEYDRTFQIVQRVVRERIREQASA